MLLALPLALVFWIVAEGWLHERGHALMAKVLGFRVASLTRFHCEITGNKRASVRWMLVSLAGPATDLALCLVLVMLWGHWFLQAGAFVAAMSLVGNLAPWRGSDGFRFLSLARSVSRPAAY